MGQSHSEAVQKILDRMVAIQNGQTLLARRIGSIRREVYAVDLLAMSAINRSLAHCAGLKALIESRNIMCSGAILRLQLDTVLRFYAHTLVADPTEFALSVLDGQPIPRMKSREGKSLTDRYLVERLSEEHPENPWIRNVYSATSGYVHFSEKHMLTAILRKEGKLFFKVSPADEETPEELYLEILEAFVATTDILSGFIEEWTTLKKSLPLGLLSANSLP